MPPYLHRRIRGHKPLPAGLPVTGKLHLVGKEGIQLRQYRVASILRETVLRKIICRHTALSNPHIAAPCVEDDLITGNRKIYCHGFHIFRLRRQNGQCQHCRHQHCHSTLQEFPSHVSKLSFLKYIVYGCMCTVSAADYKHVLYSYNFKLYL